MRVVPVRAAGKGLGALGDSNETALPQRRGDTEKCFILKMRRHSASVLRLESSVSLRLCVSAVGSVRISYHVSAVSHEAEPVESSLVVRLCSIDG